MSERHDRIKSLVDELKHLWDPETEARARQVLASHDELGLQIQKVKSHL